MPWKSTGCITKEMVIVRMIINNILNQWENILGDLLVSYLGWSSADNGEVHGKNVVPRSSVLTQALPPLCVFVHLFKCCEQFASEFP